MQHVLQTALSLGLSATEGIHSDKPNPVDPSFDGLAHTLPESFIPEKTSRVTFKGKKQDVEASWLSIGTWPWGDTATFHYSPEELPAIKEAWKFLYENGINYIDTAQAYGSGESERIIGDLIKGYPRDKLCLQTKWWVVADNTTNLLHTSEAPVLFLKESLNRMQIDYVDVYMVHGHIHPQTISQVAQGMAKCVDEGLCKTVAVANYSKEDMLEMQAALAKYDVPLALNQCEYHVLRRLPETSGLLQACKDNGIQFQSYSSLAQGRLSGKYSAENEPPKTHRFSSYPMKDLEPTLAVLKKIAEKRNVTIPAVSLNYNISKGVLPVVGIRKLEQAQSNIQALGWRLNSDEIKELDAVSIEGKHTRFWQQG